MSDDDSEILERWLTAVNEGVRTGRWTAIEQLLRDDAEMEFVGIPVGPFLGREAIVEAYRTQPPDDTCLRLGPVRGEGAWLVSTYAWSGRPTEPAGEVHVRAGPQGIEKVRILYGRFSRA
ncbi:MAG: nuclear transport factor 2 family protein [Candidatus Dormibacteraeota bacterium]|nr:nuclear transport factor 2 family protein [Candidatus Dormibacteraeota bacterium]